MLNRQGHSLLELLVALAIGALVIGLGATIGFRHQRFHRDVVVAMERAEQLDQLVALMPISLRAIAPGEGDIAPGGARDTALEFRATIATAVICDSATTTALLAPSDTELRLASILARPEVGDTAWLLDASGPSETWVPRSITGVSDSVGVCGIGASRPLGLSPRPSIALRFSGAGPDSPTIVRITRPWRYSVYRASDGAWYLGAKDWNPRLVRFNGIQPVAGPVLSAAAGGLRFRYLDSLGAMLSAVPTDPGRIAAIDIAFRVDSVIPGSYAHATSIRSRASTVIALRNRR